MKTETLNRVAETYAGTPPDYIVALARACDQTSQAHMAKELGYSRTAINLLVNNAYGKRDRTNIERCIRTYLMQVDCPVLGRIEGETCRANQAKPYSSANATAIQLYRACHGDCCHSSIPRRPE